MKLKARYTTFMAIMPFMTGVAGVSAMAQTEQKIEAAPDRVELTK